MYIIYRSEIERLTALLLSRTKESNVVEGDKEKLPSTSYHVQNIDAFTSDSLNKHVEEREIGNLDAAFSTPVVNSRVSFVLLLKCLFGVCTFIKSHL